MQKKKMIRVISVLAVFAMLATLVPVVVFAGSNTTKINRLKYKYETGVVEVEGEISAVADITMMAVMSDAPLDAIPGGLTADDIMYIDQEKVDDGLTYTWNFKPRDTVEGSYITVFLGGTDVNDYVVDSVEMVVPKEPGTVTYCNPNNDYNYYVYGEGGVQVIDFTQGDIGADWLAGVEIGVYDGTNKVGFVDKTSGNLTFNEGVAAPNEAKSYTIQFEDVEGFESVEPKTVSVISQDSYSMITYIDKYGLPSVKDENPDSTSWQYNIPGTPLGITLEVTVDGKAPAEPDSYADGVLTVVRNNAEIGLNREVKVTATSGSYTKELLSRTVYAIGQSAIKAEYVSILPRNNVYGIAGAKVVTIKVPKYIDNDPTDDDPGVSVIDPETQTIFVGKDDANEIPGTEFLYSPERSKDKEFFVFVAILRTDNTDAATVADKATIENKKATKLYYAKPNDFTKSNKVIIDDVMAALEMFKDTKVLAASGPGKLLSADVTGTGKIIIDDVMAILAAFKDKTKADLDIFSK